MDHRNRRACLLLRWKSAAMRCSARPCGVKAPEPRATTASKGSGIPFDHRINRVSCLQSSGSYELVASAVANQDTSNITILVPLLNPKFATVPAERSCELRVRGMSAFCKFSFRSKRTGRRNRPLIVCGSIPPLHQPARGDDKERPDHRWVLGGLQELVIGPRGRASGAALRQAIKFDLRKDYQKITSLRGR